MEIPQITLGIYRQSPSRATDAIVRALELGYRSIDTAAYYENESSVGEAIRQSGIPRSEIFVTSKIWNSDQGSGTIDGFNRSLENSGLDYFDCYLIHWPERNLFADTWERLQEIRESGLSIHLGVSNFLPKHLKTLEQLNLGYKPYINQVEMHPYLLPQDILDYDHSHGIKTSSWSPLGNGYILRDFTIRKIATHLGRSPSQVALRWAIQKNVYVIPKATSDEHLKEDLNILDFKLSTDEMRQIDALNRDEHIDWDPHDA